MKNRPDVERFLPAVTRLSAIVGHELNNIAVPLQGFLDLAAEGEALSAQVRQCFQELRTGVARISSLAFELESLATASSTPTPISIAECVGAECRREAEWRCDPSTTVMVDPFHARAAIEAIRRIGKGWRHVYFCAEPSVAQKVPLNPICAACGKSLRRFGHAVLVQVHDARLSRIDAIRELVGPDGVERSRRAVTLAVLMHSGHSAGGHVVIDERAGLVGLAFPSP